MLWQMSFIKPVVKSRSMISLSGHVSEDELDRLHPAEDRVAVVARRRPVLEGAHVGEVRQRHQPVPSLDPLRLKLRPGPEQRTGVIAVRTEGLLGRRAR